jgi:EmrB/QacA subfamily drug resistance transporter
MTRPEGPGTRYPAFGVFVVGLGTMVVPFDSSVNVAFPHIIRWFGLSIPAIQWVVIAYTLTYAALTLVFGRVGDMVGHRRVFQWGNVIGAAAFLFCAAATTFNELLIARVLQGVGAALALSCGPALATSLYPEARRTRVLGVYTMIFGIGSALGPLLAGLLVQAFGWQVVFWFRAPFALLAFLLTWTLPRTPPAGQQRFDAAGAALLVIAVTGLLLTLNQLRGVTTSPSGFVAAGLVAVIGIWAFIRRALGTAQPILDLRFFRDPDFALVTAANALLNLAGFSIMLLVPFYLDRLSGLSVPATGLVLASSPAGIILAGPVAGMLATRLSARQLALAGAATMAVAQIVIGMAGEPANIPLLAVAMFAQGFGLGMFQVACFDICAATIPARDRGVAGSLAMMTRTLGVVTGATVLMLIFQTLRGVAAGAGQSDGAAFLAGFQGAFHVASALSILVVVVGSWRGWARWAPS